MLRRLFVRIAIFLLPFAILAAAAVGLGIYSGEAMPLSWVFSMQDVDPEVIYFPATADTIYDYKRLGVKRFQPDTVIVGTSVLRFVREDLFAADAQVYNAYVPAARTNRIVSFLHEFTPETRPQIVIIGVDLSRMVRGSTQIIEPDDQSSELSIEDILLKSRVAAREVLSGNQTVFQLLSQNEGADSRRLGLRATIEGRGFRYDGSLWQHTDALQFATENRDRVMNAERERLIKNIKSGELRIQSRKGIFELLFSEITRLESMGVEVIGIVMPFSMPSVMDVLPGTPLDADLAVIRSVVENGFAAADAELFDFFDPRLLDLTDEDMPDGVHTTPEVTGRLLTEVILRSPSLRPYSRETSSTE